MKFKFLYTRFSNKDAIRDAVHHFSSRRRWSASVDVDHDESTCAQRRRESLKRLVLDRTNKVFHITRELEVIQVERSPGVSCFAVLPLLLSLFFLLFRRIPVVERRSAPSLVSPPLVVVSNPAELAPATSFSPKTSVPSPASSSRVCSAKSLYLWCYMMMHALDGVLMCVVTSIVRTLVPLSVG